MEQGRRVGATQIENTPNLSPETDNSPFHADGYSPAQTRAQKTELPVDIAFLRQFGVANSVLIQATRQSRQLGQSAAEILICNGAISEPDYFRYMAQHLNLSFDDEEIAPENCLGELGNKINVIERARLCLVRNNGPILLVYISPDGRMLPQLKRFLIKYPSLKNRIVVTTNSAIRQIYISRRSQLLSKMAIFTLRDYLPVFSAATTFTRLQIAKTMVVFVVVLIGLVFFPLASFFLLHIITSVFFMICVWIRTVAAIIARTSIPDRQWSRAALRGVSAPVYSVLVALYDEENQIEELVSSLSRLKWPHSKLEIKLICEGDDLATINAVKSSISGPPFELVIIPPTLPRTKPKALNFALQLCRGEFVVLYDAEDRPHPQQLLEAFSRFRAMEPAIACLQAPLVVNNHHQSWLSSLFAIEYSALFSGLLPVLAVWRAPVPLGGTSNHFRRSALIKTGAWDPYNVTEDADLGMRLARFGYKTGVLKLPTFEEAPISFGPWIRQRTRWFKGWLQTWLVHTRRPIRLIEELGIINMVIFHTMITGMIVSALAHPFFIISLAYSISVLLFMDVSVQAYYKALALVDVSNILLAYGAFAALAWRTLPISGLAGLRRKIIGIPIYWLLVSIAAWRALWHLFVRPFEWEKTPHGVSNGRK